MTSLMRIIVEPSQNGSLKGIGKNEVILPLADFSSVALGHIITVYNRGIEIGTIDQNQYRAILNLVTHNILK